MKCKCQKPQSAQAFSTRRGLIPVVLISHAQSLWNLENRFTGWADPSLTAAGLREAESAAQCLRICGYRFDAAHISRLQRATVTRDILLQRLDQMDIPRHEG